MPKSSQVTFTTQLKKFKENIFELRTAKKDRLVLIIMSNTHDPALCTGCVKDAAAIKKVFKEMLELNGRSPYKIASLAIVVGV